VFHISIWSGAVHQCTPCDHKSAALSNSQICLQEFKMKEDHASCQFKDMCIGITNHLVDHNQTLTNWNGSCFSLAIMSLVFLLLVPTFLKGVNTLPIFAFFAYAYMGPTCFVKCSSLLVFSL